MTPEQAIQAIETIILDDRIRGFNAKQVLILQQAMTVLKKTTSEQQPSPAQSESNT